MGSCHLAPWPRMSLPTLRSRCQTQKTVSSIFSPSLDIIHRATGQVQSFHHLRIPSRRVPQNHKLPPDHPAVRAHHPPGTATHHRKDPRRSLLNLSRNHPATNMYSRFTPISANATSLPRPSPLRRNGKASCTTSIRSFPGHSGVRVYHPVSRNAVSCIYLPSLEIAH